MVVLREEVVEAEEGLHDVSQCCACREHASNVPPAPPGIGGGGGGGGGGGAGILPDVDMLSVVFWRARVSQSNRKDEADWMLPVECVQGERRISESGGVVVGGCLAPEDKQLRVHAHEAL
jgi:hypothetical protein